MAEIYHKTHKMHTLITVLLPLLSLLGLLSSTGARADGVVSEINDGQIQAPKTPTGMSSALILSTPFAKALAPSSSSSPSAIPNPVPNTTISAGSTATPFLFTSGQSTGTHAAMTTSVTYPMNTSVPVSGAGSANATSGGSTGMGTSMAPTTAPNMPSGTAMTAATAAKATGAAVGGSGKVGWGVWALGGFAVVVALAG